LDLLLGLTKLQFLEIQLTQNFKTIQKFTKLTELSIIWDCVDQMEMGLVGELTNLKILRLMDNEMLVIGERELLELYKLTNLQHLHFTECRGLTFKNSKFLSFCGQLTSLGFNSCSRINDWSFVSVLTNLRDLELKNEILNLRHISLATSLQKLSFAQCQFLDGVELLANLKNLTALSFLENTSIQPEALHSLVSLTNLQYLALSGSIGNTSLSASCEYLSSVIPHLYFDLSYKTYAIPTYENANFDEEDFYYGGYEEGGLEGEESEEMA